MYAIRSYYEPQGIEHVDGQHPRQTGLAASHVDGRDAGLIRRVGLDGRDQMRAGEQIVV